jgi:antitoxin PrlF
MLLNCIQELPENLMPIRAHTVPLNRRRTITLPKSVLGDLPEGTIFVVKRRDDGVIELQPRILVDPAQAWFWSPEWQAGERRVDADKAAGRVHEYEDADAMFSALDAPAVK